MEMEINYVNHSADEEYTLYYENYLLVSIVLLLPFSKIACSRIIYVCNF